MGSELIGQTQLTTITKKTVAIVKFGMISALDGMQPATYYQVTIDPEKVSPCGRFIRFGNNDGDEIIGWQKADRMTIVSILAEWIDAKTPPLITLSPLHEVEMQIQLIDEKLA
jgi:hypothetical protein